MRQDFSPMNEEENLRVENEFLKMKIMLEHGGQFGELEEDGNTDLPPEIENQFLNNVLAFEKQFSEHKVVKVYDKIGGRNILDLLQRLPRMRSGKHGIN